MSVTREKESEEKESMHVRCMNRRGSKAEVLVARWPSETVEISGGWKSTVESLSRMRPLRQSYGPGNDLAALSVAARYVGRRGRCMACGLRVTVR